MKTLCIHALGEIVGPLSTADAGWVPKRSPPTVRIPTRMGSHPVRKCQAFLFCFIVFPPCRNLGIYGSLLCRQLTARATMKNGKKSGSESHFCYATTIRTSFSGIACREPKLGSASYFCSNPAH